MNFLKVSMNLRKRSNNMKISQKYLDICLTDSKVDILEGTTSAGKTTTMISTKFLYMVEHTKEKRHLIAAKDLGTAVSNIISTGTCGLIDMFPEIEANLKGNSDQPLAHLKWKDNIIFIAGYDDESKWKKVLGKQLGAVFIDEMNIASMSFLRELFLPRFEYLLGTLNPDNPDKEVYKEFINRCRPIEKYKSEIPEQIIKELNSSPAKDGWYYWFCTFDDNPSMTLERKEELLTSLLPETREYQTKILGIRTVGTGLVCPITKDNIITEEEAKTFRYQVFSCGIDTSYSSESPDIFAMVFDGITTCGKLITLEEEIHNNTNKNIPSSPSDMAIKIDEFFNKCCQKWGITRSMFIDNADAGTITEVQKYSREHSRVYYPVGSWKKMTIIDRINLQNGWIKSKNYLIVDKCKNKIKEHNSWVWDSKTDKPQDANDHLMNSDQYAWQPYKHLIGVRKKEV